MSHHTEQGMQIEIMGKQHQIACPKGHEDALVLAAKRLDTAFWQAKSNGIRNNEKALLVAALNLCHELLENESKADVQAQQLDSIMAKVLHTLAPDTQV